MAIVSSDADSRRQRMVAFYHQLLDTLDASGTPYLVGGSYAAEVITGIPPRSKDLDFFIRHRDLQQVLSAAAAAGFSTELAFPHWLAKIHSGDGEFADVIFNSGNGICPVDDEWFEHSLQATILGHQVRICSVEEMIWTKAFIMERERFDGAEILHLLRLCSQSIDWPRLLRRFGPHWRVLMVHLVLFGFVYPQLRSEIPAWVMRDLINRVEQEQVTPPPANSVCFGTLLSRQQYLCDVDQYGLSDARLTPTGMMTPEQISDWTEAIDREA